MAMTHTGLEAIESTDSETLIDMIAAAQEEVSRRTQLIERASWVVQTRMEAEEATVLSHPRCVVEVARGKATWDLGKLAMLREYIDPAELSRGRDPEHTKKVTVPEKWDMRVVNTWKKYGATVAAIIDSATMAGRGKLMIRRKD
jgi:hypothetical protein